jgi:hypothetical protein
MLSEDFVVDMCYQSTKKLKWYLCIFSRENIPPLNLIKILLLGCVPKDYCLDEVILLSFG